MIYNTRGIVLHRIKYGESSAVVKVYTELFGLRSYIINGVYSRKSRVKANMLQPLTLLDMGVYNRSGHGLQRIRYANAARPHAVFGPDVVKGSIAVFAAEVLYRSIREEETGQNLFSFLVHYIETLEDGQGSMANSHLLFMLELSGHLGFKPERNPSEKAVFFDKREGVFCEKIPPHADWMDRESSGLLKRLLNCPLPNGANVKMTAPQRNDLVQHLIAYYNIHLHSSIEIKSHKILQTIMQ